MYSSAGNAERTFRQPTIVNDCPSNNGINEASALHFGEITLSEIPEELKMAVSRLSAPERAELAHYLLHTLETSEEGAAEEWLAAAEQRMEQVRAGQDVGIPAEELMKSLRRPRQ